MNTVGFIGTGKMAKAIIGGIFKFDERPNVFIYDKNKTNYEYLKNLNVRVCENSREVINKVDYVILAIKPQNYLEVLEEIKDVVRKENILISIAAGIGEEFLSSFLGFTPKFVQVMPNTPLLLGFGSVAICKGKKVDDLEFENVKKIFLKSGFVCEIPKDRMNYIVSINGSSPAFIYYFAKGFLNFAEKNKIENEKALKLLCHSLIGSAKMMLESSKSIDELIDDVCSKKGTTEKGIETLKENNFLEIVEKACEETARRAFELSR